MLRLLAVMHALYANQNVVIITSQELFIPRKGRSEYFFRQSVAIICVVHLSSVNTVYAQGLYYADTITRCGDYGSSRV